VLILLSCPLFLCCGAASAAPPNLTYLYPAGAQRGTTAEVTAAGTFDTWPVKVWASGKGVTVEPGKDKGKFTITVAADAVPAVYWLRAYNDDGASSLRPFIVGTLPEVIEKEPNDEFGKAQVIDKNAVVNGRLDKPGDVDCFAVALKKGQTLVASLEANHTLRSPMDGVLQILSADGFVLDQNNDFRGLDPQLAFTAPKDGTYVARVFAFPATPDSSIRYAGAETYVYRLTLTTGGFLDYVTPLALGSSDVWDDLDLKGWNVPLGGKFFFALPQQDDTHVTVFRPDCANPVRVRLEPRGQRCKPIAAGEGVRHHQAPCSMTGQIEKPKGEVEFQVLCGKGDPLTLQVESRTIGLAVNPIIRVLDEKRKQLARAEPGKVSGDTVLSFTPPADGLYTIAVSDLYGGGGPRHAFLLRVLRPREDYELTVSTDRFAVPPGKALDIPVKVVRKNKFAEPIEVVAEGLPAGVRFEVKPPAGKADPGTIVVTLTADKAGISGPFRLVGREKLDPEGDRKVAMYVRTARAPLPEFDGTTADLWVTASNSPVPPPPKKGKK
jgi:hypothetical protein